MKVRVCPDCKGTRIYVGIGFFSAEPCRACCGHSAPVVVGANDDSLPDGLQWWRAIDGKYYIDSGTRTLWIDEEGTACGSLSERPDADRLVRLLRKKNGVGE